MKAAEAIKLLKPIPNKDFLTNKFSDGKGKCCVIGHLARLSSENPNDYSILNCKDIVNCFGEKALPGKEGVLTIRKNSRKFVKPDKRTSVVVDITTVNNAPTIKAYPESTVKKRVMHLLKDMDAAGY